MDQPDALPQHRYGCFPRTGGDGPVSEWLNSHSFLLPPHGRGWTVVLGVAQVAVDASPARAGMDPIEDISVDSGLGFPRTGGDGPPTWSRYTSSRRLPPHGRGWTEGILAEATAESASPARAGMDRSKGLLMLRVTRFPRTGGDGPKSGLGTQAKMMLPPHGRGWTSVIAVRTVLTSASPARAGMDRGTS